MTEWLWFVPFGAIGAHLALGLYNARRVHAGWGQLLRGDDLRAIDSEALAVAGDAACMTSSTRGAQLARGRGDVPEAVRLLTLAYQVVEEAAPNRRERLEAMLRFARMSVALRVPAPIAPTALRLKRLGLLASAAWLGHHLLVAPAERFALRVRVLLFGFRVALHVLASSHRKITTDPSAEAAWLKFVAGVEDWKCLDQAHLATFRSYGESVRAVARPQSEA